ncbi:GDSL-type esterase/lipase family protein [Sphingomonas abietis]|uniref:GDSL-type esterase/lipase family protein n=1 Tax=Sphingomonas abietis TaxID=3012344 RepID=A0ABY7NKY6_9SPHN|nr:GDSL-type esterase/lipase family protein [Sphingomonas abietis]WBO21283.1 GDSL-type esterase/lipase family protein [Sphingomonas abietis]
MRAAPLALIALAAASPLAAAQTPAEIAAGNAAAEQRLHDDWAWMDRYKAEDAALPPRSDAPRVVFIGDSITQMWRDARPAFFVAGRIGRGIGGQTTPQMLVRFRQDVIALHPAVVQIMAGTNDIASNTGPMTAEETEANIRTMTELAQVHGIRVILGSIPPASHFAWRPGLEVTRKIETLDAWLKAYAARTGSVYADYWSALQDGQGGFRADWTIDGVHPNPTGYDQMIPVAQRAIAEALAKPAPAPLAIADQ